MSQPSRRPVYLDNHATTRVDPRVMEVMLPWFTDEFGNASSVGHTYGERAAEAVECARRHVGKLLHTEARSVIFTSGGTESNNLAIKGVMLAAPQGRHLIVNTAEHRAVLDPARRLKRNGCQVTTLPVRPTGNVDPSDVVSAIRADTVLVSMMFVNNEIGVVNPVADVGRECSKREVVFHCDAAQAIGSLDLRLDELPIDLVSVSGHKIYAPKGIGALIVRRDRPRIPLQPLLDGGGHEHGMRSGTLAVPLIVGLGEACRILSLERDTEQRRIRGLRDRLYAGLRSMVGDLQLNGDERNRVAGNLNVSVPGVDGDALLAGLAERVAVSSGSACTSADTEPSHVLTAIGQADALARASLRFGIGRFNTVEDIEVAIRCVGACVTKLRRERSA